MCNLKNLRQQISLLKKQYFSLHHDLQIFKLTFLPYRDLISVGKRLSKEREEMSRELGKLQESVMELHDKLIMEIQVLNPDILYIHFLIIGLGNYNFQHCLQLSWYLHIWTKVKDVFKTRKRNKIKPFLKQMLNISFDGFDNPLTILWFDDPTFKIKN